ncbi:MAG: hypothetical protein K8R44_03100 [Sulfurimonas sp.]|nr:hypothetical protein [Sulfurimonas sp.]
MNINISRQNIYLLLLSVFLLVFVLIFAFLLLIPEGKEYRNKRVELKKESTQLRKYENFRDEVLEKLTELKSENRNIITAFDREFDPKRFQKINRTYFNSLTIAPKVRGLDEDSFSVYEVNTTSQINSPKSFYDFLDAVNKSDWIIGINFPIEFKREAEMIRSSFTMKVYGISKDTNSTESNTSK